MKKRLLSMLLAIVMVVGVMPGFSVTASAVETGTDTGKAIQLGTDCISGWDSTNGNDYIYMGGWFEPSGSAANGPIKWRVLDDRTNTGGSGLFLLSDALLGTGEDGGVYYFVGDSANYSNKWQNSAAQAWCRDFAGESGAAEDVTDAFTDAELGAILATTKSDAAFTSSTNSIQFSASENILNGDKVFFLSAEEAESAAYGFTDDNVRIAYYGTSKWPWWLRSPCAIEANIPRVGMVAVPGHVSQTMVTQDWSARPAFNLDSSKVLFTSAASGAAQQKFGVVDSYTSNEWKLTLADGNSFAQDESISGTVLAVGYEATELTVTHPALNSFDGADYNNVTAMLTDNSNNILYYGSINIDEGATQSTVTIPEGLVEGEYTLSVYGEQWNGAYMTDYVTGTPCTTTITVKDHIWETEWSGDNTHHWHECEAANCPTTDNAQKNGYALHTAENNTGNCVCGFNPLSVTISQNPSNYTYGDTVTLTATITRSDSDSLDNANYAWTKGGSPIDGETGATLNISNLDIGDYTYTCEVIVDGYRKTSDTFTVTVGKAASTVSTAPDAVTGLTYNGAEQTLVTAGTANGGTMQYSLDGQTYSTDIPTGANAGDYTVWYKVVGDESHNDSEPAFVKVHIAKIEASVTTAPAATSGLTYTGEAQALITAGTAAGGTMQYSLDGQSYSISIPTSADAGDYSVWYKVVGDENHLNTTPVSIGVSIAKAAIGTVAVNVTAPVALAAKQTSIDDGTGCSAAIEWNTEAATFGFNTAYTATVILTADSNHKFAEGITVEGWNVQHSESKLTLTKTFEATRKAKLTELTDAPANMELEAYHTNAAGAIAELPTTVAYATERGPVTVAIEWSCADYNSATKATNTFAWSVKAGELDNYDANSIAANGSITVTNVAALPVNNSGADKEITYNGETYNVSEMFSIDENAGAAIYTITGGDGAGALDGSVLTITKAGTITIKLTTAANDPYAAGEATATLTVNKAAGTGTVTMEGWTYGDEAKAPVASDAKGEATFTYNTNDGKVPTNAGTYTVTATFAATDLYEEATATATFTIAKKSIIVKAVAVSKTYGEADPELTYTATGLVGEDKLSGKLNRAEGEDVGTYAIEQGTLTAGNNYAVTYTGANLTINAKAVTITGATIEDVLFAEGGYALNVTGVTFEGVIDGDTLDYTATATLTGENKVGVAAATVTVTLNNGNYSLATATYEAKVNIVEHTHVWSFTASGDTITATCSGTIGTCPVTGKTVTITLSAPTNLTYDGKEKTVTVTQSPADVLENVPAEIKGGWINAGTHTAELTYGGVTATLMFTINGIAQDAPAAPELDSKTYNSVTLKAIATNENGAAAEYSKDGGATWQASPNFTDLSASTKYSFAARYGATGNFAVSPSSAVTEITTDSAPSGGGYVPDSYTITTEDAVNGTVKADRTHASSGTTVTLTVAPDKGYTLESLTVTDKNGKEIELTNKSDGKYTFEMPGSEVTVKATFMDDNTMLSFFVDVPADAYYYDAVLWAAKEGITNGTSATTFSPDNPCTRAQMATFLWRAAGAPEPVGAPHTFTDVPADAYYAKAVQWAYEKGITCGTSATTYSPDEACTRGQMVTFLCRMADGKPVSENGIFSDISADKYYAKAVQWAYEQKITSGTSATTFSPDDPCTRAQMVTFLYRYFVM